MYTYRILFLFVLSSFCDGNHDAKRLYDDLLSNYNKLIRPVGNSSEKLTVRFGLKFTQLIDVVSNTFPYLEHFWGLRSSYLWSIHIKEMHEFLATCLNHNIYQIYKYVLFKIYLCNSIFRKSVGLVFEYLLMSEETTLRENYDYGYEIHNVIQLFDCCVIYVLPFYLFIDMFIIFRANSPHIRH